MIRRVTFFLLMLLGGTGGGGLAAQTVISPPGLAEALATAGAGTTLLLAPGEYGALVLKDRGGTAGAPLVLRAADPSDPPRLSGLTLSQARHVVLDGLVLDYRFTPGDPLHVNPFAILDSLDITLRNSLFDGDVARGLSEEANGFGYGYGLGIQRSSGIVIERSEFRLFHRALVARASADLVIRANDIHTIRSDGMNFAQVQGVVIEANHIHDFQTSAGSSDHADMIQFWTSGTTAPSRNIVIRENVLNSGGAGWTQSIFMRNELVDQGKAGSDMLYRDIRIEGNVIFNAHLHGISVGETAGLVIANNTLLQNAASKGSDDNPGLWTPAISVSPLAIDVTIARNLVARIAGPQGQADWRVVDNMLIQNRTRAEGGFYDRLFVAAGSGDPRDLASIAYRADGPLHGAGLGAPRLDAARPVIEAGRP